MSLRAALERLGLVAADANERGYDAFISYGHAADGKLAPALQRGLQRFAKPWYRRRALRVFRDDASLSANPGLWSSIVRALESSGHFVLLASPQAAESEWVAREAEHWCEQKGLERLLIVLTEGDLVWDPGSSDFDWTRTSALPACLRGVFREEPRFVDLRWARDRDHLSLSHPDFRDAVAELAAPLHGIAKDELAGEEVRQQHRTVRIARAAAAALACLTLASVLFGAFALVQRNEARNQRDVALSRSLVQEAAANLDGQVDLAALLSLEAFRIRPNAETRSGLVAAVQRAEHMTSVLDAGQVVERIVFTRDRARLAAAGTETVLVWDLGDRDRSAPLKVPVAAAKAIAFSADGKTLAVGGPQTLEIWRLDPQPQRTSRIRFPGATALAFTEDGHLSAVGPTSVVVFDGSQRVRRWPFERVAAAAFTADSAEVVVAGPRVLTRIDLTGAKAPVRRSVPETLGSVAISTDGRRVAALDLQGEAVTLWMSASGGLRVRDLARRAGAVTFAPDGRRLVLGGANGDITLLPLADSERESRLDGPPGRIHDLAFPEDHVLATAGAHRTVVLWDPTATALDRVLFRTDPIADIDVSEGARTVVAGGLLAGVARIWTFDDQRARRRTLPTSLSAVAIDAAGERVAVAERGVVLYEPDGRTHRLQPATGTTSIQAVAFSSDGVIAWAGPDDVPLWDAENESRLGPLRVQGTPSSLAFSGDGDLLAVGTSTGSTVWDVRDGKLIHEPVGGAVSAIALSRSGRLVASATSGGVDVWDARRRATRFVAPIDLDALASLALSPDESTLAIGTDTGEIGPDAGELVLVDTESGRRLGAPLPTPGGAVKNVDFSPDGQTLVVGTQGGRVTLWDDVLWSDVSAMRELLCAVAGRNLTTEEWREHLPGQSYRTTCP